MKRRHPKAFAIAKTVGSPKGKQLLTPKELAKLWGIHYRTLGNWRSKGAGPAYVELGRHIRYRLEDVLDFEKSRLVRV